MPHVTVNGVRFFVQKAGTHAETVVLIHGMVVDNLSSWWLAVAPRLSRNFSVICYDQRGHGLTDRPRTGYGVDDGARDLFALLDKLAVQGPVHVVGNSYGGVLAMAAAIESPERFASVALVDSFLPIEAETAQEEQLHYAIDMARTFFGDGGEVSWRQVTHGFDDAGLDAWIGSLPKRRLAKLAFKSKALVMKTSLGNDLRRFPGFRVDDLRKVSQPVLMMYGGDSQNLTHAHRLCELLPRPTLRVFPGRDHFLLVERPEAVTNALAEWLPGVRY